MLSRGAQALTGKCEVKACCSPPFMPISYPAGWEFVRKTLSLVENEEASLSLHICYINCDLTGMSNTCLQFGNPYWDCVLGLSFSGPRKSITKENQATHPTSCSFNFNSLPSLVGACSENEKCRLAHIFLH